MSPAKQRRASVNISLPADLFETLEGIHRERWLSGITAIKFRDFVSELCAIGWQEWARRNMAPPPPPEAGDDGEGDEWGFDDEPPPRTAGFIRGAYGSH